MKMFFVGLFTMLAIMGLLIVAWFGIAVDLIRAVCYCVIVLGGIGYAVSLLLH